MKDYTNQIHGCWKVLERDKNPKSKSHETFWLCECQNCGSIKSVRKTDLDKNPRSCNNCKGQLTKSWQIGDRYGLLQIIGKGTPQGNHTRVLVQCDCGSAPFEVRLEHLKGQNHSPTISCGCLSKSSGELKIEQCLQDYNYQTQYIIPELSKFMPFDFAIFKNGKLVCLIEFDGEQHYRPIDFLGGEDKFKVQQANDQRRNQFCREHDIPLIRIPYYDYDKITPEYMTELISSCSENKK